MFKLIREIFHRRWALQDFNRAKAALHTHASKFHTVDHISRKATYNGDKSREIIFNWALQENGYGDRKVIRKAINLPNEDLFKIKGGNITRLFEVVMPKTELEVNRWHIKDPDPTTRKTPIPPNVPPEDKAWEQLADKLLLPPNYNGNT